MIDIIEKYNLKHKIYPKLLKDLEEIRNINPETVILSGGIAWGRTTLGTLIMLQHLENFSKENFILDTPLYAYCSNSIYECAYRITKTDTINGIRLVNRHSIGENLIFGVFDDRRLDRTAIERRISCRFYPEDKNLKFVYCFNVKKLGENIFRRSYKTWETRPRNYYLDQEFTINMCGEIINIPIDFKPDFDKDYRRSVEGFIGI